MDNESILKAVKEGFDEFGVDMGKDPDRIFKKATFLCSKYKMDATELVDSWVSFAATKGIFEIDDIGLDDFEKQELSSRKGKQDSYQLPDEESLAEIKMKSNAPSKVTVYGSVTGGNDGDYDDVEMNDDYSDVLRVYGGDLPARNVGTPKSERKDINRRRPKVEGTPSASFVPQGFSPAVNSSSKSYNARAKAGETVLHYKCKDSEYWNEVPSSNQPVKVFPAQSTKLQLESDAAFKYMFQKTADMASTLNSALIAIGFDMLKDDEEAELQDLRESSSEIGLYLGKICSTEGKLTPGSIYLEGDIDISGGHVVSLDVTKVEEYRLFSGQVVLVKGQNELGRCLRATEIIVPMPLPMPTILPKATRPLNIVIACGPYTPGDSFLYEPLLKDLINVIKRDKPDLCILMGPFVDSNHPMIAGGDLAVTFKELFESITDKLKDCIKELNTHVVLVSNHRDVHHHVVYPTPRYSIDYGNKFTVLPDPAVIDVGGVTIGLTSTDILMHLANNELARSTVSDRMSGLSKHILCQRNFYPLYPPDDSVPFDVLLWAKYCRLFGETPHILVLPSELRYFIKDVNGTIVVNPERLTKAQTGGTYARLQVKIPDSFEDGNSVADFCCGEIVKI